MQTSSVHSFSSSQSILPEQETSHPITLAVVTEFFTALNNTRINKQPIIPIIKLDKNLLMLV